MARIITDNEFDIDYEPFREPFARWFSLRDPVTGLPPRAQDFEHGKLEEYHLIVDVTYDPFKIFYRETGKTLENLYGNKLAGHYLDDLYNDWFRKRAYESYRVCCEEKKPVYERHKFSVVVTQVGYYKIHLPFGKDKVTELVNYIVPLSPNMKVRRDWEKLVKMTDWFK